MNSKERKKLARQNRAQQDSQSSAATNQAKPARPEAASGAGQPGVASDRRGQKLAMVAALVVVVGLVSYAVFLNQRPSEPSRSGTAAAPATTPTTPPAVPPPATPQPAAPAAAPATPTPVAMPTPTPPPAKPTGPAIRFASTVFDMGRIVGDAQVDCTFWFTNVGIATLEIENVIPACGCMRLGEFTKKAEPGQAGKVLVRYDSRHYIGHFAKSTQVVCNDPAQRNVSLEITGNVWRAIEVKPESAVLNLCAEVPTNVAIVKLISHVDEPLILSDLKQETTTLAVELQTNQPGKEYQLVVRSPVPTPTNSERGQITLKTSTTNMPVLTVNTFVNALPILMPIPMQVRLPLLPLETAFTNRFWVKNNGTNTLELSDPVINAEGVTVTIAPDPASSVPMGVTMVFPAGFDVPAGTSLTLRIKSKNPLFPELAVPVMQSGRRPATKSGG